MSRIKVWYDLNCPYCYNAAFWLWNLESEGLGPQIEWKAFSLEQVNLTLDGDADELWANPGAGRGLIPLAATKWAELEGPEVFKTTMKALLEARHELGLKIGKPAEVEEVLDNAGLPGGLVVEKILAEKTWINAARADHEEGAEIGVFGVPTFGFPDSRPIYMKMTEVTAGDRAADLFNKLEMVATDPLLQELKRP